MDKKNLGGLRIEILTCLIDRAYLLSENNDMKDRLTLEIQKGADEKNSKVGVSIDIDSKRGKGSDLKRYS